MYTNSLSVINTKKIRPTIEFETQSEKEELTPEIKSIGELSWNSFTIPTYQRPYKWTAKNVNQLISDINFFKDRSAYRLGTLVLHTQGSKLNIVDGQQRIITLALLLSFLFEKYKDTQLVTSHTALKDAVKRFCDNIEFTKHYNKYNVNYVLTFGQSEYEDSKAGSQIRMLEAMFHVSAPTQIYKYWLQAVLYYVGEHEGDIDQHQQDFRDYLFHLAQAYMLDRYLCDKNDKTEFYDIIYKNGGRSFHNIDSIQWENLNGGCDVENFVFNYYDFLVWNEETSKYSDFEFTYRTSVEHFYPQHPIEPYEPLTDETGLNDFGNLCLISRGMNSKFSNSMPKAKYDNFGRIKGIEQLSIKLQQMFDVVRDKDWNTTQINEFTKDAFNKIGSSLRQ